MTNFLNSDFSNSAYSDIVAILKQRTRSREDALGLRDKMCRSRFFLHPQPTEKVLLFFHGFTAVPEQFVPIAHAFFQSGYNVLIPLLPGHGQEGHWDADQPPPLPETTLLYQQFGLNWLDQARQLGDKVIVGGLSGGSTLAAWLCLEQPTQIDRSLLFAPYLSNPNKLVDWFVQQFNIYFAWKTEPGAVNLGYEGFYMPALRVFLELGQTVLERVQTCPTAPLFVISSESDAAVGNEEHQALFSAALKSQPKCWYHCFDRRFDIPHNMMTIAEGNEYRDLVIAVAKAYVESDLTWQEVQAISSLLAQGVLFTDVIAKLKLDRRASPHLLAMLSSN